MSGPDAADSDYRRDAEPVEPAGLGANPSGPEFVPASPPRPDESSQPSMTVQTYQQPSSRWPNIISAALLAIVAMVVIVASAVARYGDTHVAAPGPITVPAVSTEPSAPSEIEFATAEGSGRLILLSRTWRDTGREPPANGNYLQVQVKIICTAGRLGYDPYNFQAFDHTGELFDVAEAGISETVLGVGELFEGQSVQGYLAFDIPRGEVTLLMSDDSGQSSTALKVPA
jgi:hypothetical protein